jgi:hypothetical protein
LFGDVDGELRVGHLRLLIVSDDDVFSRGFNFIVKELRQLGTLQGGDDYRFPDWKVSSHEFLCDGLQSQNARRA